MVRSRVVFEPLVWLGGLTGLLLLSFVALLAQVWQPQPLAFLGLHFDRLTTALALLVALVGLATYRFSLRYLDGEPGQLVFLRRLALTVVAAWLFMLVSNVVLLFVTWLLTSLLLHGLLLHYSDRAEAHGPAWTKFVISRLGDALLLAALYGIVSTAGTWDLYAYLETARQTGTPTWIVLFLVLAALTKSAQVPFHVWLPETLEAPTPVSALMHAGIINAGGALLLRFAPVLVLAPTALVLLVLFGTLTAVVGALAMWSQVKAKRVLAWSTVSQMGFMMVQLGLTAFPAALLHLIGHGLYKAHAFLRVGAVPPETRLKANWPLWNVILLSVGALFSLTLMGWASWLTGFDPWRRPGEYALALIVGLASAQLWVAILGARTTWANLGRTIALQAAALVFAFAVYRGAVLYLEQAWNVSVGPVGTGTGKVAWIPVLAFGVLTYLHLLFPWYRNSPRWHALHLYALHGFYLGPWLESCWRKHPRPTQVIGPAEREKPCSSPLDTVTANS